MWHEALPSCIAMGACMSIIEISGFVTHYISWGCPMMRNSITGTQDIMQRRDQRIAEGFGVNKFAAHMYTFGFSALEAEVKESGNVDHYKKAEEKLKPRWEKEEN